MNTFFVSCGIVCCIYFIVSVMLVDMSFQVFEGKEYLDNSIGNKLMLVVSTTLLKNVLAATAAMFIVWFVDIDIFDLFKDIPRTFFILVSPYLIICTLFLMAKLKK